MTFDNYNPNIDLKITFRLTTYFDNEKSGLREYLHLIV